MMLWDNDDQAVRQADITVRTGRKWKADGALREAEERLQHVDIVGMVTQRRLGVGAITCKLEGGKDKGPERDGAEGYLGNVGRG